MTGDARRRGDPGRGPGRRRVPPRAARSGGRPGHGRPAPDAGAPRCVPRRARRRPGPAGRRARRAVACRRGRCHHRVGRPQPADRGRRRRSPSAAGGGRGERAPGVGPRTRPTDAQSSPCSSPGAWWVAGASSHPASSAGIHGLRRRLPRQGLRQPAGESVWASTRWRRSATSRRRGRPRVRVHAGQRQRGAAAPAPARIRAAFLTSAGYGEAGEAGRRAEDELVALADETGILLAGPNGQGVVSTPANLCAQIGGALPAGRSHRRGQPGGNFVSSFLNFAVQTGIGISRAVSANAAAVTVADYLDYYADDEATAVGRLRRGHRRRPGLLRAHPLGRRAQAGGARQGATEVANGPRRARCPGQQRPHLRWGHAPGRCGACRNRRGSLEAAATSPRSRSRRGRTSSS